MSFRSNLGQATGGGPSGGGPSGGGPSGGPSGGGAGGPSSGGVSDAGFAPFPGQFPVGVPLGPVCPAGYLAAPSPIVPGGYTCVRAPGAYTVPLVMAGKR